MSTFREIYRENEKEIRGTKILMVAVAVIAVLMLIMTSLMVYLAITAEKFHWVLVIVYVVLFALNMWNFMRLLELRKKQDELKARLIVDATCWGWDR